MIRNNLYLDSDQRPIRKDTEADGSVVRCPYCGRVLMQVKEVVGASRMRLFCRSRGCKLFFTLESYGAEGFDNSLPLGKELSRK